MNCVASSLLPLHYSTALLLSAALQRLQATDAICPRLAVLILVLSGEHAGHPFADLMLELSVIGLEGEEGH
jgi:hypothetical protein